MIIVVEGPDNSGKTTLAQVLTRYLKGCYVKTELRPVRSPLEVYAYHNVLRAADSYAGNVIADRHHIISEPIYGNLLRNGHCIPDDIIRYCASEIFAIYCRPPTPVIMVKNGREQMDGVEDNLEEIIRAYDQAMLRLPFRQVVQYDFTTQSSIDLCKTILNRTIKA